MLRFLFLLLVFCLSAFAVPQQLRREQVGIHALFPFPPADARGSRALSDYVDAVGEWWNTDGSYRVVTLLPKYVLLDRQKNVLYLDAIERRRFFTEVDEFGRLCRNGVPIPPVASGYDYVMDHEGSLYVFHHSECSKRQYVHHSTALAGGSVAAAGKLWIDRFDPGVLEKVNMYSGHYEPPAPALWQLLHRLRALGALLTGATVEFWNEPNPLFYGPRVMLLGPRWSRAAELPQLRRASWFRRFCGHLLDF